MHKAFKEVNFNRIVKYLIFGLWELVFKILPYSPLRIAWLKLGGVKIGKNCVVEAIDFFNLDRTGLNGLKIGNDCYLGAAAMLDLAGQITLEDQVSISAKSVILSHHSVGFKDHPLIKHYPKKIHHTRIKQATVIGIASIILPGITVGEKSLVAAGAVVRTNVPSQTMVAGVPAEVKKDLK